MAITWRVLSNILHGNELKLLRKNMKLGYGPHACNINLSSIVKYESHSSEVLDDTAQHTKNIPVYNKILYNCVLEKERNKHTFVQKKIIEMKQKISRIRAINSVGDVPVALKHLGMIPPDPLECVDTNQEDSGGYREVNLPYSIHTDSVATQPQFPLKDPSGVEIIDSSHGAQEAGNEGLATWMADYEQFDDDSLGDIESWRVNYGTPNRSIPVSNVPCGGCGALLHCQDPGIPGYLPSELFQQHSSQQLRGVTCQRCHFMRHYNMALSVNVSPEEYPRLLSRIQSQRALVIIVVDLMDFPCSVWPGILNIIGCSRPVVVVGNKVDLLPADSRGYLDHVKTSLTASLEKSGITAANIKHVALVSARTGYGIEELITKLQNSWEGKGDVYLVGCTNVGKSTLFNCLLQSDYCKVQAVDLIQRATTSPWPGTTLNLLKFPILRPAGWQLYVRTKRLIAKRNARAEEKKLLKMQGETSPKLENPTLIGHIERTFRPRQYEEGKDVFAVHKKAVNQTVGAPGLDPEDSLFAQSRWCYDTPGTVQPDQVLDLLTTEELLVTLPRTTLSPRTFLVRPGASLFIAGLARLDYLDGPAPVRFTVLAADSLPLTVCESCHAEEVYSRLLGTRFTLVPGGSPGRLDTWPGLAPYTIHLTGVSWHHSCADVVLSSAGWVAVTPGPKAPCSLRAWTPAGRGVHVRQPPLLRHAVQLRGKKLRASPAYAQTQMPRATTDVYH